MRIHYIYLTTNLTNNKKYIGQRKCPVNYTPEKDPYFGSGNLIISAIKKYGKENFKKDILEICHCNKDADKLEKYYFDKYDVLNKKDEFYNRAMAGQFWRDKGHSEYMSNKMKDFYNDEENYKKRFGITREEKAAQKKLEKEIKSYNRKIETLNRKIEKAKYNYFRELTKDLRKEFYNEKNRQKQKIIWSEKKKDPEFLEAVKKGKDGIDYKKLAENRKDRSKENKNRKFKTTKYNSIIYDKFKNTRVRLTDFKCSKKIGRYASGYYKKIDGLEKSLKDIYNELVDNNINISFNDLLSEAKIKYRHLYE